MEQRLEHKTDNLETYLDAISTNIAEKTEVLGYILANRGGRYLEIGAGGDPIASIVDRIPPNSGNELVAIDADPSVLEHLLDRHPQLSETARQKGIPLDLVSMDATNMQRFADNSFDGINASSLVHEIFSYAEGFQGIRKFVSESHRILKPGGVLVYRDPELSHPLTRARMEINEPHLKVFSLYYLLHASLDRRALTEDNKLLLNRLDRLYDSSTINILMTELGKDEPSPFTLDDIATIQLDQVDLSKPMAIEGDNGILKEIARHYLTSHQISPYGNILLEPDQEGGASIDYISNRTRERFRPFALANGINLEHGDRLTPENYELLQTKIATIFDFLSKGVDVHSDETAVNRLSDYAKYLGANRGIVVEKLDDNAYRLDPVLLSIIFEQAVQNDTLSKDSFANEVAFDFFAYLRQEAQEFYYYLTPDEVIAVFAATSFGLNDGHMLVPNPENGSANRSVERPKYEKYLNTKMNISSLEPDIPNNAIAPNDNKRIIHFIKLPIELGIRVLEDLTANNEHSYRATEYFLSQIPARG